MGLFKRTSGDAERSTVERAVRHSRGWGEMQKVLRASEGRRVLDFGPTSPANISFLTELGHSVYMSNAASDAAAPEWRRPVTAGAASGTPGSETEFDVQRFCASNLDFSGRTFDVILLWDTANYLPVELVPAFFKRIGEVLQPGGHLLAFFQAKQTGPETVFSRYQLAQSDDLTVLRVGPFPIVELYQTRQIERFLAGFQDIRFFLGKDNVREVFAVR